MARKRKHRDLSNNVIFPDAPSSRKTESTSAQYESFYDGLTYIPRKIPKNVYYKLEWLANHDDAVSKIKTDFVNSVLSGLDIQCENTKVKEDIVDLLHNRINKNNGGINGLISRWATQSFIYDEICGEILINENLTDIKDFITFDPKSVVYIKKNNEDILCQEQVVAGKVKELPTFTCFHYTTNADNDSPYSNPRLLSVLQSIDFKTSIEKGIKNQVDHWGFNTVVGSLDMKFFQRKEGESDVEFNARIKSVLNSFQKTIMEKKANQPILTTSNFKTEVIDGVDNADDIASVNSIVYSKIANSLKVDKMMLNQGDFNTDVYNTVPYENFLKQVGQAQSVIKDAIEKVINIYKLLKGIDEEIIIKFVENQVNDEFKSAQAMQMKVRAFILLYQYGILDGNQVAQGLGYDKAAVELKPWEMDKDNRAMNGTAGGDNANG